MSRLFTTVASLGRMHISRTIQHRWYSAAVNERIKELVEKKEVVVFMKGVPAQPQCGFSNAVMQILNMHGVEDFDAHNVLEDEELRQGIKEFSNWPTIPQVYMKGEFIGGCDIMIQLHQSGELIEELEKIGIRSALLDAASQGKDDSSPDKK